MPRDTSCQRLRLQTSQPLSRLPAPIPRPLKQLRHFFHWYTLCLWRPKTQHDESDGAYRGPKDVGTPYVERYKHVGRHADNGKLEEPVNHHVYRIAGAADASWIDFCAVEVLYCTQADGPARSVDEDAGDSGVGGNFVGSVYPERGVHGHVDVCCALHCQSRHEARPAAKDVHETPSKDHGEDELDGSICTRSNEGLVLGGDSGVLEDFGNVVGDAVAAAPLGNSLEDGAEQEALAVCRDGGNLFKDCPCGCVGESSLSVEQLASNFGKFNLHLGVLWGAIA